MEREWNTTKREGEGRSAGCTWRSWWRERERGESIAWNGSVEILDRLFYGSLDYDFTGLRFQYRRAFLGPRRVPDNRPSPRGDQFSAFSMFRYVAERREGVAS